MRVRTQRRAIAAALTIWMTLFASPSSAEPERSASVSAAMLQRNAWYLPTQDGAANLFVTEVGTGAPVVFLHGGPGNDFQYVLTALEPHLARHRFILFDNRGSLLSPVPAERRDTLTLNKLVDDLESLRMALGSEKLTLFGHSFGSLLALRYYEAHPDRVERLVLTGAFPPKVRMTDLILAMRARQKALRERAEVAATLLKEGLSGPTEGLSFRQRAQRNRITGLAALNVIDLARWRDAVGGGVFYDRTVDAAIGSSFPATFDFTTTIKRHPIPIAIVQGDRDYVDPGASGWSELTKSCDRVPIKVTSIRNASHTAWIDDPTRFAEALEEALARTSR